MESPVMTSASSHRLRSAVSACVQPTHSYLSSSYLGTSIPCESHDSGGCFKKFNNSGKNSDSSFLLKLNITKKPNSSSDSSNLYKRQKITSKNFLNGCYGSKIQARPKNVNLNWSDIQNSSNNGVLNTLSKQFMIGNDFLSKLKVEGNLISSKRLATYLNETLGDGDRDLKKCDEVVDVVGSNKNYKNNKDGSCDGNCGGAGDEQTLNNRNNNCTKGKNVRENQEDINVLLIGKNNSISNESERSDQCCKCGLVDSKEGVRNKKQEISKWQPKHVVTRKTSSQSTRRIRHEWQSRVGPSSLVPSGNVQFFFNTPQLPPSFSPDSEMLECANECSEKPPSNCLTFGEFYINESSKHRGCRNVRTSPPSRTQEENVKRRNRKFSKGMSKYEVFLGGSCNPTTWRTDFAIPELDNMNITYYNPQQVEEWRPELLEVEHHAKANATVMFFVIDNQTRGVSALIEVAHLAGNQRKLILVIQSYTQINQIICDEEISQTEYEDLKNGQEVLRDLVERRGIPVFDDIKVALKCTEKVLREDLSVQDLHRSNVNRENSLEPREVFDKLDSGNCGEICAGDACLALTVLTGQQVTVEDLAPFIKALGSEFSRTPLDGVGFDFVRFNALLTEFKRQQNEGIVSTGTSLGAARKVVRDVYLGGTVESTTWRESIAIPLLQSQSLTFFTPKISKEGKRFTEVEAAAIESTFIILFVITDTARSIAAMAIAGHYIGKGANVVLCIQHLPTGATIGGTEKLSESAIKDYNRGRMYLMDIAKRSGIRVFDEISGAVEFVVERCKSR